MAQLRQHEDTFRQLNAQVLTISFTQKPDYARAWLEQTGSPYTFLMDPDRTLYDAYGLRFSLLGSWSPRTIAFYARSILTGTRFRWFENDTRQLGGDFIVDRDGIIRFAHRSAESADRPNMATLLGVLQSLEGNGEVV